jgi:hypothetical protein
VHLVQEEGPARGRLDRPGTRLDAGEGPAVDPEDRPDRVVLAGEAGGVVRHERAGAPGVQEQVVQRPGGQLLAGAGLPVEEHVAAGAAGQPQVPDDRSGVEPAREAEGRLLAGRRERGKVRDQDEDAVARANGRAGVDLAGARDADSVGKGPVPALEIAEEEPR